MTPPTPKNPVHAAMRLGMANCGLEPSHLIAPTLEWQADRAGVDLTDECQWAAYLLGYGVGGLTLDQTREVADALQCVWHERTVAFEGC